LWTAGDATIGGKLIVNGRDILAELDNRVKYDSDWIQMQSDATNAGGAICVDAGSLSANCNWNNGYRRLKFTKVQR